MTATPTAEHVEQARDAVVNALGACNDTLDAVAGPRHVLDWARSVLDVLLDEHADALRVLVDDAAPLRYYFVYLIVRPRFDAPPPPFPAFLLGREQCFPTTDHDAQAIRDTWRINQHRALPTPHITLTLSRQFTTRAAALDYAGALRDAYARAREASPAQRSVWDRAGWEVVEVTHR